MNSKILRAGEVVALAAIYYCCGTFGLSLAFVHESASAVWPPTGVALAALLFRGRGLWPGVFVGAFLLNYPVQGSVAISLGIATGNTLEAVCAAALVERFTDGLHAIDRTRNLFRFVLFAAMASTILSATIGVTSLCLAGSAEWNEFLAIWVTWWLGDIVSNLIIAPLLLVWLARPLPRPKLAQVCEAAGLLVLVVMIGEIVFVGKQPFGAGDYPLEYLAIPPLLWASFRFGERGAATYSVIMSGVALWGTRHGLGPFARSDPNTSLLLLQAFMGTITMTALVLASLISERQRAEDMRVRLAGIVESSEDAIISKNLEGIITSWNAGAERLFGYHAGEIVGQPDTLITPSDHRKEEASTFDCVRRGEAMEHYETVRLSKDGRLVNVSLTLSPVRDASGAIVGASKIARDITQRKKAEAALRTSEALFRQLADAMPQIVWAARPDGYIDYYNQRWYDFTGFQECYGDESWKPILHPDDVQRCLDIYFDCIKTECPYEIEYRFKDRKTNGYRWFLGRALPVRDEGGKVIRWFGTCTDIDEQKQVEEALAQAQEVLREHTDNLEKRVEERTARLQETIRSLDSFCYSIAHDLRAPLRALSGFSIELFSDYSARLDETGREYLHRIKDAALRMDHLILDLLELGKLNTVELPTEAVELDPLIRRALVPLESAIRAKSARIHVQQPLLPVRGSPVILDQILANLLGNALKFVSPGTSPKVEIWTEQRAENIRISVRDNGIGMKAAHLQKIFLPFVRLVNGGEYPGTGIGLAIVRKGAERMGGRVGVESEPGKGSCFWIELPSAIQPDHVTSIP